MSAPAATTPHEAALRRLNERAAKVAADLDRAYQEGRADADSLMFWSGFVLGALSGAIGLATLAHRFL